MGRKIQLVCATYYAEDKLAGKATPQCFIAIKIGRKAIARGLLLILGIVSLLLLRRGYYYLAANLLTIGAIGIMSLLLFFTDHAAPVDLVLKIISLYLFILSAALLSKESTVITAGLLTIIAGISGIINADVVTPAMTKTIAGSHISITIFITIQC